MPPFNAKSWKQLATDLAPNAEFGEPAEESLIDAVEKALGVRLPAQLHDLLWEADGITEREGHVPIWPLTRIEEENRTLRTHPEYRELYMPFDHLLFFGAERTDKYFAFPINADGRIHSREVFVWSRGTDSRYFYALHLEGFLARQLKQPEKLWQEDEEENGEDDLDV